MEQLFDHFGYPELPYMILCNPNKDQLYSLGLAYDRNITIRFNALSEFSFTFPMSIDGGTTTIDAYEYIRIKRLVLLEGYGYFQILDVKENLNGTVPVKNVVCQSLESELIQKRVSVYTGTKKLYDAISPSGTILQDMVELVPTWSVGTIDAELTTKYRTFNVSNSNVYNFLIENVCKAFDCVFIFDTVNKTISAKTTQNATTATDIFLSFDNIIDNAEFDEKSDEIVTALSVYGGGDLTIRSVNPLGTNYIYDFSYYANSGWMSSGLASAVSDWKTLVSSKQTEYSALLSEMRVYKSELIVLQGELSDLEAELAALETTKSVRIQGNEPLGTINSQIAAKQAEITNKNSIISNKQSQIDTVTAQIVAINDFVSFDNNFSESEFLELNNFIFENTYQNQNIIVTDAMDAVEIQDAAQDLYDQATGVLDKVSQPRYEISINAVNYIALSEFSAFTSQTNVGSTILCEIKTGVLVTTVLLELSFNLDDPTNAKMIFSNRLRLDGDGYRFSDLQGQVIQTGSQVSFNSDAWSNWSENYKDEVSGFITSSLNAATNSIITNSDQEMKIDQTGLRGRKSDGSGGFQNNQVWLTNNVLAFSDDGFSTSKLALGQITTPSGGTAFGLVADYVVGRILAGNSLTITNSGNNFTLDANGATLTNAKFSVQTTNSKIIIDPTSSTPFRIQKNQGGSFVDKFSVSNAGDVTFSGILSGASGSFSGSISASSGNLGSIVIDSNGLKTSDGINYLKGNGDLKWGALSIVGGNANFSGTIYANKIFGEIQNSQLGYGIAANKITVGTMSADRIYGGTIGWDNVSMGAFGYGWSYIAFDKLSLLGNSGDASLDLDSTSGGFLSIYAGGGMTISTNWQTLALDQLYLYSNVSGDGGYGINDTIRVQTSVGQKYFVFDNGILTNVY